VDEPEDGTPPPIGEATPEPSRKAAPKNRAAPATRAKRRPRQSRITYLVIGVPAVAVALALLVGREDPAPQPAASASAETIRPEKPRRTTPLAGVAKEVIQAASYTYVLLQTEDEGEQWAAVNRSEIAKGDSVLVEEAILMEKFESKALSRTFPRIWFGTAKTRGIEEGEPPPAAGEAPGAAPAASAAPFDPAGVLAPADVMAHAKELAGKKVRVAGEVTKVNEAILDRNWIHLTSGAPGDKSDLLVTSKASAKVGERVTVTGTLALDKDYGAGYRYSVVLEDADVARPKTSL